MKYSVLFTTYYKDNPNYMKVALESILEQTLDPDEIIISIDKKITKIQSDIIKSLKSNKIKIFINKKSTGLGECLREGVINCKNDLILRMDSDDISMPDRAEKMINHFHINNYDLIGSGVNEFDDSMNKFKLLRKNVLKNINHIYFRNPINHPTVLFKKSSVIKAGNYISLENFEDWYLWLRMKNAKFNIGNYPHPTLYYRVDNKFYKRRSGLKYLFTEIKAFKIFFKEKLIPLHYIIVIFFRFLIRVFPFFIIKGIYFIIRKFLNDEKK